MSIEEKTTLAGQLETWLNSNPEISRAGLETWLRNRLREMNYALQSALFVDWVWEQIHANGTTNHQRAQNAIFGSESAWVGPIPAGTDTL